MEQWNRISGSSTISSDVLDVRSFLSLIISPLSGLAGWKKGDRETADEGIEENELWKENGKYVHGLKGKKEKVCAILGKKK